MWFDDDDDDKKKKDTPETNVEAGDYNYGDDIGQKIGEGHDRVEDEVL